MTHPSQLNVMNNNYRFTKTGDMGEMVNQAMVKFNTPKNAGKISNCCCHTFFLICSHLTYYNLQNHKQQFMTIIVLILYLVLHTEYRTSPSHFAVNFS